MTEAQGRDEPAVARRAGARESLRPPEPQAFEAPADGPAPVEAVLAALGLAAFTCDSRGLVCGATPAAAMALELGRLRLAEGRLAPPPGYDAAELDLAIAQAGAAGAPIARTVVNRDRLDPGAVQVLDVIALPKPGFSRALEPRVVVVLRGGLRAAAELEAVLARAFGLTSAEAEVAARLARGERRMAIAAARRASLQTVRSQIKNIFCKLGVTREPELVALLAGLTQR